MECLVQPTKLVGFLLILSLEISVPLLLLLKLLDVTLSFLGQFISLLKCNFIGELNLKGHWEIETPIPQILWIVTKIFNFVDGQA